MEDRSVGTIWSEETETGIVLHMCVGTGAKAEGRKSHAELRPEVVTLAKRLHRASPKSGKRRSLRKIAAELERVGHLNERGRPYAAQSVKMMLEA